MSEKEKKKFWDTGFGKFLTKAKDVVPELAGAVVKAGSGNVIGAIGDTVAALSGKKDDPKAQALLAEFEMYRMDWEKEMFELEIREYEMEIADRDSARNREARIAESGKTDWMQIITGLAIILAFGFCIWAIVFWIVPEENRSMFHHLLGMIEGAFIGGMVQYYFGSSKGSKDKTKLMSGQK